MCYDLIICCQHWAYKCPKPQHGHNLYAPKKQSIRDSTILVKCFIAAQVL